MKAKKMTYDEIVKHLNLQIPENMEFVGFMLHEHRPYGAPGSTEKRGIWLTSYLGSDGKFSGDFIFVIEGYSKTKTTIELKPLFSSKPHATLESVNEWIEKVGAQRGTIEDLKEI